MKNYSYSFIYCILLSCLGVFVNLSLVHADEGVEEKIVLGNKSSPIKLYFISDWFCPSCIKAEPVIEEVFPKVQSKVAFYFIDHTINRESLNYTPYNLAFLINNKPQYIKIRSLLSDLTKTVRSPKDSDISSLAEKVHVDFKELPYTEVKAGLEFFNEIAKKYQITSTPVIVIVNTKTDKTVKLQGSSKMVKKKILKAIDEAQKG